MTPEQRQALIDEARATFGEEAARELAEKLEKEAQQQQP